MAVVHSWLVERMAEEHRRDLSILGAARNQPTRTLSRPTTLHRPTIRNATAEVHVFTPEKPSAPYLVSAHDADPATRLSTQGERRPVGHQVGTLLIRLGTRLGGASIRTS